jgi:hypothetical protein
MVSFDRELTENRRQTQAKLNNLRFSEIIYINYNISYFLLQ